MSSDSGSSADVQREVENERAELVNTLDQLRENLKPANVVDEVMASAKISTADITDRVWKVARANPIPAALIGIGALMLVGVGTTFGGRAVARAASSRDDDFFDPQDTAFSDQSRPGGSAPPLSPGELSARLRSADARAAAASARISESAGRLRDQADGQANALRNNLRTLSGEPSMAHYSRSGNQISDSITRLFDEQPLVLAALGVAVGAAIGAAIPTTDAESRLMGDASVQLKSRAQQLAASEYEHLKEAAGSTLDNLKQTAADHGLSSDNLQGLVQDAGSRVRDAAHDVADHAAGTAGLKS